MNNQTKQENELAEVENKYFKDMYLALTRLYENPDFQAVILQGYFKDKAVNGVSMLATEYTRRNNVRSEIFESLIAISHLEDYFHTISQLGREYTEEEEAEIDEAPKQSSNIL